MSLINELLQITEDSNAVEVPQEFQKDAGHINAYKQGHRHGKSGGKPIYTGKMLIPTHADAYKAGFKAGAGQ